MVIASDKRRGEALRPEGRARSLFLLFHGSERILLDLRRSVLRGGGVLCGNEVVASGADLSYL